MLKHLQRLCLSCVLGMVVAILFGTALSTANPLINEVMSSNSTAFTDQYSGNPDWIEFYNPTGSAIDLAGYGISDNPDDLGKWVFPSGSIDPGGFLILCASDRDITNGPYFHAPFKIKAAGETLILTDPEGAVCDSLTTFDLATDTSMGRYPDGGAQWLIYTASTPGASNSDSGALGYAPAVSLSQPGGFYPAGLEVAPTELEDGMTVRYTTDGSEPDDTAPLLTVATTIDKTTVLRARAFVEGYLPGPVTTATYFTEDALPYPVVSIATAPANLFDYETGIYVYGPDADSLNVPYFGSNFWSKYTPDNPNVENWERPISLEFFETNGSPGFAMDAGVQIGGGWSRRYPRKSFNIYARNDYGADAIPYQLFPNLPTTSYDSFQLRNSGNDWGDTIFRDAFMNSLSFGMNIDTKDYRPAVVFLNGEYWGIYGIRERMNEDYLTRHYGIAKDNLDILEIEYRGGANEVIRSGDDDHFRALEQFINTNSLSDSANFAYVNTQMDVNNFMDFTIAYICVANYEWGTNNVKYWRPRTPEGRWRWLSYDFDRGFALKNDTDYNNNTLDKALNFKTPYSSSPKLLTKLVGNTAFKYEFLNRTADCLNTRFETDHVIAVIDSFQAMLEPGIHRHIERWDDPYSERGTDFYIADYDDWLQEIQVMKTFAEKRPDIVRSHYRQYFGTTWSEITLDVSPAGAGTIKISTIVPTEYPWTGAYFNGVPVTVTAIPAPGYRFDGWSGIETTGEAIATVTFTSETAITASFVESTNADWGVVINEINYNSSPALDPADWVELCNPSPYTVDISGWVFKDANDENEFAIPQNTTIGAGEYLVLATDITAFHEVFPGVDAVIGNIGFNLSNGGELVRLYDNAGALMDSLTFDDAAPWPIEADGTGATLALTDPALDNALPESWESSDSPGTPGRANNESVAVEQPQEEHPGGFILGQNYPNPFNPATTISYQLPQRSQVTLSVYSASGQHIATLVDMWQPAGMYSAVFDGSGLASGLYFTQLDAGGIVQTGKMLLIK